jgi:hypothetical protein
MCITLIVLWTFYVWSRGPSGFAVDFICELAVNVDFALGGFNWEFFLKPATAAANISSALVTQDFHSNGFFAASWAREELRQTFLWNMNNFLSSSPHSGTQ